MNRKNATTIRRITMGLLAIVMLLGSVADARPNRHRRNSGPATEGRQVVNINQATEDQLQFLPGIGPSKSRAIVRYRAKRKFKTTFQIVRVKGIGRKTYRKLRPFLTLSGPTTVTAKLKLQKKDEQ